MITYKEVLPKMKGKRGESMKSKHQEVGDPDSSSQAAEWHSQNYHISEQKLL